MRLVAPASGPDDHEALFVARYAALLRAAEQLTGPGHEEDARDLVQEAFIRFTIVRPDITGLWNLDGYLYTMLRNMHLSQVRRAARAGDISLSILDFDAAHTGLLVRDVSDRLETIEALRAACRYGCRRRLTSKAASVFLLRFFHGYVPSEIARILRTSSVMVDTWVRLARREVKVAVYAPERVTWLTGAPDGDGATSEPRGHRDAGALHVLDELRETIFAHQHDTCFDERAVRRLYEDGAAAALDTSTLAEIVTCRACLNRVSDHLGLPRVQDRCPSDNLGPGRRGGGGSPPAVSDKSSGVRAARSGPRRPTIARRTTTQGRPPNRGHAPDAGATRRCREVLEHRPDELRVAVNGHVLGTQKVGARRSELTLSVNVDEPVAFIEVLSEQDVCLLFLNVTAAPDGPVRQQAHVTLSDGRSVDASLVFSGQWPLLRVVYEDPVWIAEADLVHAGEHPVVQASSRNDSPETADGGEADPAVNIDESAEEGQVAAPRVGWPASLVRRAAQGVTWDGRRRRLRLVMVGLAVALVVWATATPGAASSVATTLEGAWHWVVQEVREGWRRWTPRPETSDRPGRIGRRSTADIRLPMPAPAPVASTRARPTLSAEARAALELDVLARLEQVHAYLGHEVAFRPPSDKHVQLDVIVDADGRKDVIRETLQQLATHRALRVYVRGPADVVRRSSARPVPLTPREFTVEKDRSAAYQTLRAVFHERAIASGGSMDTAAVDDEVRRFANGVLDRSRRASQHVTVLQRLAERYPRARVEGLDPDAKHTWFALVREHAEAFQREIDSVARELRPIFQPNSSGSPGADRVPDAQDAVPILPGSTRPHLSHGGQSGLRARRDDVWQLIAELVQRNETQDRAVHAALIASADGDSVNTLGTPILWQDIDASRRIAALLLGASP